jgi:hypothetical protein
MQESKVASPAEQQPQMAAQWAALAEGQPEL